jgi:hypothetical protein
MALPVVFEKTIGIFRGRLAQSFDVGAVGEEDIEPFASKLAV